MAIILSGSAGVTTNSGAVYDGIQGDTAKTATGTSVDFTSIPSWVKRITVMFSGVSTSGTSNIILQVGGGSVEATGYLGATKRLATSTLSTPTAITSAVIIVSSVLAAQAYSGVVYIINLSGNNWIINGTLNSTVGNDDTLVSVGTKSTSATLDRIRITTVNGTDTFDAGSINILYE